MKAFLLLCTIILLFACEQEHSTPKSVPQQEYPRDYYEKLTPRLDNEKDTGYVHSILGDTRRITAKEVKEKLHSSQWVVRTRRDIEEDSTVAPFRHYFPMGLSGLTFNADSLWLEGSNYPPEKTESEFLHFTYRENENRLVFESPAPALEHSLVLIRISDNELEFIETYIYPEASGLKTRTTQQSWYLCTRRDTQGK